MGSKSKRKKRVGDLLRFELDWEYGRQLQLSASCGKGMEFERFGGGFDIEDMIEKPLASDSDIHRF